MIPYLRTTFFIFFSILVILIAITCDLKIFLPVHDEESPIEI